MNREPTRRDEIAPRNVLTGVLVSSGDVLRFLILPGGLVLVLAAFVGVLYALDWLMTSAPDAAQWAVAIVLGGTFGVAYLVATIVGVVRWLGRRGAQHRRQHARS